MTDRMRPWPAWILAVLELLVAYQAIDGAAALLENRWDMPTEWLSRTPFDTWTGPGWLLLALVAGPQFVAALTIIVTPLPARIGIGCGVGVGVWLLVWIALQLVLMGHFLFLQPVVAAIGLIEVGLALWWRKTVAA